MGALSLAPRFSATFSSIHKHYGGNAWPKPGHVAVVSQSGAVGTQAIKNITGHIGALYAAGARDFFVPDLADFSFTFVAQQQPAEGQAALSSMTAKFNLGMDMALDALEGSLSGITIRRFDTNAVLKAYRADLVADGGTLTDRCWGGSYGGGGVSPRLTACSNPDKYFLFDAVHPTSGVHQALGMAFAAAVPEPSTTGLALVWLLGVAVTVGRRRAASLAGQAAPLIEPLAPQRLVSGTPLWEAQVI